MIHPCRLFWSMFYTTVVEGAALSQNYGECWHITVVFMASKGMPQMFQVKWNISLSQCCSINISYAIVKIVNQ